MPLPIRLAHRLVQKQAEVRKGGRLPWLKPDAKSQVSVRYKDKKPVAVEKVVLSTQHAADVDDKVLRDAVIAEIIEPIIPVELRSPSIQYLVNPTGRFVIGGPVGDTGLTGRKIIVDTYGGSCPHGGGAFSGKDPTKVDRSAAYAARYIAKNIVAAGLADHCTVQLAYVIGVVEPFSLMVNVHSGAKVGEEDIEKAVRKIFQLTPAGDDQDARPAPARSTSRPRPTAISAASSPISPGSGRTRSTRSRPISATPASRPGPRPSGRGR